MQSQPYIYCCEIELHHKDFIIPLKLSLTSKLRNISVWYSWRHHQSTMIFLSNVPLFFEYSSNQQLNGFTFQGLKGLKGIVQSILPLIISKQETISLAFLCSTYFYSEQEVIFHIVGCSFHHLMRIITLIWIPVGHTKEKRGRKHILFRHSEDE